MKNPVHPPGPHFLELVLLYFQTKGCPIEMLTALSRRYGDVVRFRFRAQPDFLITDPESIEKILRAPEEVMARSTPAAMKRFLGNGLLTSQGAFHKTQRRAIQPAFHLEQIRIMTAMMSRCVETHLARFDENRIYDMDQEMKNLTLDIILLTMFGTDLGDEKQGLAHAVDKVQKAKNKNDIPLLDVLLDKLPLPRNRALKKALARLDQTIYKLIAQYRSVMPQTPNFLSMLIDMQKNEEGETLFSDRQIRDEAVTMFAAGHETISNALTWTWYLLSENPLAAEKLYRECAAVLQGRTPGFDDLKALTYTRCVFQEAMRLYPPVWIVGRRPLKDFELDAYTLPQGAFIHISQYLVHHDARFHESPETFKPERWSHPAMKAKRDFSYFPFGGGTRLCIGEEFAWAEGILVLAAFAQRFRFRLKEGHPVEKELSITLHPKNGMLMRAVKIKQEEAQSDYVRTL